MSIPSESFLLQNKVQILNAKLQGDNVLQSDIADLSDHCPVISLQMLEVWFCQWTSLAGMEHCALHTSCTHGHMF